MIDLFSGSVYTYGTAASIRVIVKYEKQRVGVDMQYRFYYKIYVNGTGAYYQNNVRGTFILNGTTVWTQNTKNSGKNWSYEYTSDWFTIENKVDASATIPFKFTIKDTINSSWCNYSSSTYKLTIDPAGSDFNVVPNFNIGQPFSLTTTKYNVDFYDKIVIMLGETIIKTYENVISPLLVQFSQEELDNIYELTKTIQYSDFTFEISSYEDDEMTSQVGATNTTSSKGYIVASNPVISSKNAIDINTNTITLTGDNTKVIKGFSNIEVTINASGQNKATIKSITVNNQDATNGSITFNKETTNVFNIVVTDSRGFQTTDSIILTLIDYVQLSLNANIVRNQPTDNQVKISYSGNYFNESFGSVANTLSVQYRFKEKGQTFTDSDTWIDLSPTKSNNTFSQSNFLVGDVDYQKMYEFQIRAVDKLMGKQIIEIYIPKGETVFNWDDELFNVNVNGIMQKDLEIKGNLKAGESFAIDPTNSFQTTLFGSNKKGYRIKTIRSETNGIDYFPNDCTGIAFTGGDTHGFLFPHYNKGKVWIGAGNADKLNWVKEIKFKEDYVLLYENDTGSNETITLNETSANYEYIDIFFQDNNATPNHGFTRVYKPDGKYVFLHAISLAATGGGHYLKTRTVEISGTSIATVGTRYGQAYLKNSTSPNVIENNNIYITRVMGYK